MHELQTSSAPRRSSRGGSSDSPGSARALSVYRVIGPDPVVSESALARALVPPAHGAPNSGVVSGLFLYLPMKAGRPGSSARSNVSWRFHVLATTGCARPG